MRSRRRLRARGAGLILVVAGWSAGASAADSPWLYGIHWFGISTGPASHGQDVSLMTGGKLIWSVETVMTNDGGGDWGPEGQLAKFQGVVGLGHTIIMRTQPFWDRAFPWPDEVGLSMSQFLDQVTHTATLYKDVCHIWILGNEMNLLFEWGGRPLSPEAYIDAAAQFSDRIKAVASSLGPQIVLVGPAAVGIQVKDQMHMVNTEYINRMCDRINSMNYRSKFDGFAMHAYAQFEPVLTQDLPTNLRYFETEPGYGYQYQIGLLDAKGFESYPVYITEWNRTTGAGNSPEEWASAVFLHNAFARINTWNQSHHPVTAACWYVYADDYGWPDYSILRMKNTDTPDHDLWHAYQYAAGFNYPAGFFHTPVIGLSTDAWSRSVVATLDLPNDTFTVRNAGVGTLSYTISDDADWLSCSPTSGDSTGEADSITVSYSTAGLATGPYHAVVTVSDPNATPISRTIAVEVQVKPIPGDFDDDHDVDQQDFGSFQVCYSGSGVIQTDPACQGADLDGDNDVDAADFAIFQGCFRGPAVTVDPHCADGQP
jgi:hypothetical protein